MAESCHSGHTSSRLCHTALNFFYLTQNLSHTNEMLRLDDALVHFHDTRQFSSTLELGMASKYTKVPLATLLLVVNHTYQHQRQL
jgi:hypothetical protein